MVEGNKILTVSYGTFSCTLEGFEDSFTTMKAIAEYFRDLASDDRYFGAEPPTPDAAMLARIAEREVARRVEATVDGNDVMLRTQAPAIVADLQSKDDASVAADQPAPVVEPAPETADLAAASADQEAPEIPAQVLPLAQTATATTADDAELEDAATAAAMQMRLNATTAASSAAIAAGLAFPPAALSNEPQSQAYDETSDHQDDDSSIDGIDTDNIQHLDEQADTPEEASPESGSVSAKLQRIRAVVAPISQGSEEASYTEDQHANDDVSVDSLLIDEADASLFAESLQDQDPSSEDEDAIAEAINFTAPVEDDMSSVLAAIADDENTAEIDLPVDVAAAEILDEDGAIDPDFAAAFEGDDALTKTEVAEIEQPLEDDDILGNIAALDDADPADAEPLSADATSPIARVIKVKRKDFEAALAAGDLEEVDTSEEFEFPPEELIEDVVNEDEIADQVASALGETSLSDEDEAELMAELAAVQQEVQEDAVSAKLSDAPVLDEDANTAEETETPQILDDNDMALAGVAALLDEQIETEAGSDDITMSPEIDAEPQPLLDTAVNDEDDTVDRLMSKTQSEFDAPETGRRRNAIAHLKAAVAATRAERDSQGELVEVGDQTDSYRDDLAQVVRPRRAEKPTKRSERPVAKVPPLTLVAAQRVDIPEGKAEAAKPAPRPTNVRPRRVAKSAPKVNSEEINSFQEFAEAKGARELPDLLEAAAAYAAYIKGEPNFTRPELMRKVSDMSDTSSHSREDSLRSFGQLLREGKIVKIKKGTFTVAEDTRFRPNEARFAGE
ncbi:hypothetical protein [Algirhabdus cladophorae]|uniref:hypothetical protein n=1 Tax=Algirhabdus cladophorae TaxID=3377108 RepID=UPI003B848938